MDQIPVAGWVTEAMRADLLLPAGVGQWIGVEVVEPAPDHGRFYASVLGAEALMVPVAPFQGVVDLEPGQTGGVRAALLAVQ